MTPDVNGKRHHFSAGGLYNGLVLLIDDESRSYWNHITGEALHGELAGERLSMWGIEQSTVGSLLQSEPDLLLLISKQSRLARLISWLALKWKGKLPLGFRFTMFPSDKRLPEMTIGLGIAEGAGRFYSLDSIGEGLEDEWQGNSIRVEVDAISGVPSAVFADGSRPVQLFSRWYGFSQTFPDCEIR